MRTRPFLAGLLGLVGLVMFWGLAIVVAIDDFDFFYLPDFLDMTALHHEHLFVALILLGIVALGVPMLYLSRRWAVESAGSKL